MSDTCLVLSLATSGFKWRYRSYIQSHREYAARHSFTYSVVDRPRISVLRKEIVWLKLYLIREALLSGYDWVFFVDADACFQTHAPNILEETQPNKHIYMAHGYSGRFNSGVMLFRNHPVSLDFLEKVIKSRKQALPVEDDVGWGENGHIIHHAKSNTSVGKLSQEWNNNKEPALHDYIRHYSAGPLRANIEKNFFSDCLFTLIQKTEAIYARLHNLIYKNIDEEVSLQHYTDISSKKISLKKPD